MAWETWSPVGGTRPWRIREVLRVVMGLHATVSNGYLALGEVPVAATHPREPAMHTRVRITPEAMFDETTVRSATNKLLDMARGDWLDRVEDLRLPDLALLAHLQHNGAATPLLDVTVDPFVALWMVVHASGRDVAADDGFDGALFGIRRRKPGSNCPVSATGSVASERAQVAARSSHPRQLIPRCPFAPPSSAIRDSVAKSALSIGTVTSACAPARVPATTHPEQQQLL